jgi:tRNA A22 N-methylase
MYYVHEHHFGRKIITKGPMSGCLGLSEHYWTCVKSCRKKSEALAFAEEHSIHTVVTCGLGGKTIFDNKKEPGKP